MKHRKFNFRLLFIAPIVIILLGNCKDKALENSPDTFKESTPLLTSKNGSNSILLSLNDTGELFYKVGHDNDIMIEQSPLGLICNDQDFTKGLSLVEVTPEKERIENYELIVGHQKKVRQVFKTRSATFKNKTGALLVIDLIAGSEGVAFRYRFPENSDKERIIEKEITGFRIEKNSKAWLQPYNKAGDYTPAYEDFYFNINVGDGVNPRNQSVGWCMPALFNINNKRNWLLIAESATDRSFCGCHLNPKFENDMYTIAFAKDDEVVNIPLNLTNNANPRFTLPWTMPWRVIIIGNNAGDILLSTLITDLAPESKIEDSSWIHAGKASWSWWSHNEDQTPKTYNDFTDLAVLLNWEYTLFDAGWENANKSSSIIETAVSKGVKPFVWGYSEQFYNSENRKKIFKEFSNMGISGVKIDFWCSDRQEAISAMHSVFEDAAKEKLMINLHGSTVPRGWHRTWPNFVTAEAVLGTESYFYDERYPEKAAEQNTILPFTRNVAGPIDYTPVALTIREYPRLNTAAHELATAMIYTSGVIHFADSKESFESMPEQIQHLLRNMPATWDKTEVLIAEPSKAIVLYRQKDSLSYIVGINGTEMELPLTLDLEKYKEFSSYILISEGEDSLMEFNIASNETKSNLTHSIAPRGGFIIQFKK